MCARRQAGSGGSGRVRLLPIDERDSQPAMFAQATIKLTGPMDHLRLVWQTGETLLDSVVFDENPEGTRYNVLLALQEMVTNVLRHAYQLDVNKPIEVCFELDEDRLQIELRDQGPEFDPLAAEQVDDDYDMGMPTEVGGHGIRIARMIMDDVTWRRERGWNILRLVKAVRVIAAT